MQDSELLTIHHQEITAFCDRFSISGGYDLLPLQGGKNNKTFRLVTGKGDFLLKVYFQHKDDSRERQHSEYSFARFAWNRGIKEIPQPLESNKEKKCCFFEFIEGASFSSRKITEKMVNKAADFILTLNKHRGHIEAQALPLASESSFSLIGHLVIIRERIERLKEIQQNSSIDRDAYAFVHQKLVPLSESIFLEFLQNADSQPYSLYDELEIVCRCLSPSDFGFHNAILLPSEEIKFFDFEYAGWDDPAKLVADFFSQVEVPVSPQFLDSFSASIATLFPESMQLPSRVRYLLPLYRLKWCCIALNEFLSSGMSRRCFSEGEDGSMQRKESQLKLAQNLFYNL